MRYWKALAIFIATDFAAAVTLLRSLSGRDFISAELLAACHARLGQIDEAGVHADAILNMYPALRVAGVRLWKSFRKEADRKNLVGARCRPAIATVTSL